MKLLKNILFGSFWSFLLILSGVADISIGIIILAGILTVKHSPLPIFIICFVVGLVYLGAGLAIGIVKTKKHVNDSGPANPTEPPHPVR